MDGPFRAGHRGQPFGGPLVKLIALLLIPAVLLAAARACTVKGEGIAVLLYNPAPVSTWIVFDKPYMSASETSRGMQTHTDMARQNGGVSIAFDNQT
jgi:hypothetical protein